MNKQQCRLYVWIKIFRWNIKSDFKRKVLVKNQQEFKERLLRGNLHVIKKKKKQDVYPS